MNSQEQNYADNNTIKLNYTVTDAITFVDTCWYNVINSTGDFIISNTTITDCLNTTFGLPTGDINYNITLFSNDSLGNEESSLVEFGIRTDAPVITLDFPTNNWWFTNTDNNYFNFTATDLDGIDMCRLYSDFTSSWELNETFTGVISGIQNYTTKNLSDGNYEWNVWCNDTLGNEDFSLINYTINVDSIIPNLVLNSITTTVGSQTISFNSTVSDTNLDVCKYIIYNLAGGVDSSNVFTCNDIGEANISSFATFNLTVIVNDSAGNENITSALFTVSAEEGAPPGGGGGGVPTVIIPGDMEWTLETEGGGTRYQFNMIQGSARIKDLLFENIGTSSPQIRLHCEESSDSLNLCDYIKFEETSFYLPLQKDIKHAISFNVIIPKDLKKGDYIGNIIATDDKNNIAVLTVEVNLETFGFITKIITKMGSSKIMGNVKIPYFFIFLFSVLILGFTSSYFFKKIKMPGGLGLIVGLVGGLALLLIV